MLYKLCLGRLKLSTKYKYEINYYNFTLGHSESFIQPIRHKHINKPHNRNRNLTEATILCYAQKQQVAIYQKDLHRARK